MRHDRQSRHHSTTQPAGSVVAPPSLLESSIRIAHRVSPANSLRPAPGKPGACRVASLLESPTPAFDTATGYPGTPPVYPAHRARRPTDQAQCSPRPR